MASSSFRRLFWEHGGAAIPLKKESKHLENFKRLHQYPAPQRQYMIRNFFKVSTRPSAKLTKNFSSWLSAIHSLVLFQFSGSGSIHKTRKNFKIFKVDMVAKSKSTFNRKRIESLSQVQTQVSALLYGFWRITQRSGTRLGIRFLTCVTHVLSGTINLGLTAWD